MARNPDRSWWHPHGSLKLFFSGAPGSMDNRQSTYQNPEDGARKLLEDSLVSNHTANQWARDADTRIRADMNSVIVIVKGLFHCPFISVMLVSP